ncbi:Efflux pump atB [Colletotrichum sidae]|uniref:Efflux pump atB n=1 Tax=Colletotrichum sidae TaxID=1347389 RepID=A0A4R8TA55_9PEZI|nr:Efflux pump atB [Colletotrichum sidae]
MNVEFGVSSLISTLGLSSFVLGIGLGPAITSPLSEYYGRRPIYLVSWSLFIISTIPSAVAKNIETMASTRFFSGFFGGTFLSVAGGTVGDMFLPQEIQTPMAFVSLAPFVGPCTGPLIGGFINFHLHWRWTYYIMLMWSCCLMLLIVAFAPETYHPVLLRRKAEKLRRETGDDRYRSAMEKDDTVSKASAVATSVMRPVQLLLREPMCLCLNLYSAILLGILYLFFLAFPIIFREQYGMDLWQIGLTFLGIIIGMCVAATTSSIWTKIRGRLIQKKGTCEPEFRLPPAMLGGILIPVGLFWFGWTSRHNIHWMVPIIGSGVDAYAEYAASALASNGLTRCSFAAGFPLFGIPMYQALGLQWATSLLAFLTLAMMPLPWVFFKYGKHLRGKNWLLRGTQYDNMTEFWAMKSHL